MAPPKPCLMWPLVITAGVNDKIDFNRGGVKVATIAAGTYYTPYALRTAVWTAMNAADGATGWSIEIPSLGRFAIGGTNAFTLLFSTGANAATSARHVLGFGAVDVGPTSFTTAANQHQNAWYADDPVVDDTGERATYERAQTVALSGRVKGVTHASRARRTVSLGALAAWKVWPEDEGSAHLNEAIERLLSAGWARFRWFPDQGELTGGFAFGAATGADYALDRDSAKGLPRNRLSSGAALYSFSLTFLKYV